MNIMKNYGVEHIREFFISELVDEAFTIDKTGQKLLN